MIDLWIHFDCICEKETQIKLHKIFRNKTLDWKKAGLVSRAVLTYHFNTPRKISDSLYVCIEIPSVEESLARSLFLPSSVIGQLPSEIRNVIVRICEENGIEIEYETENPPSDRLRMKDYELEIKENKERAITEGRLYYHNASVEEILNFASIGTEIAVEIFGLVKNSHFSSDFELKDYILSSLTTKLGSDYRWIDEALHFVCNPLLIKESYLMQYATSFRRSAIESLEKYA